MDQWDRWVEGLRAGDPQVVENFCQRYGSRLERLAENHLASGIRQRVGADDVVQSACRTFFRRAAGGQFELTDGQNLWRLLAAITMAKVRQQARFHLRQKRGIGRERSLDADRNEERQRPEVASSGPTPDEAAAIADQFAHLLELLDSEERRLVELKLEEQSQADIAQALGCSERTVRRLTERVRDRLESIFSECDR